MKLQENIETFDELGAEIWVVSSDPADKLQEMRAKNALTFPTLMDPELGVAGEYGLLRDEGNLPHPTALVVSPEGEVLYLRVDEDFSKRPDPTELIEALRKANGGG